MKTESGLGIPTRAGIPQARLRLRLGLRLGLRHRVGRRRQGGVTFTHNQPELPVELFNMREFRVPGYPKYALT
eukprot:3712074-Rhodomonas_salina.2